MKKKLLMIAMALLTAVCTQAQEQEDFSRHEVAVSYGAASNSQWISAFEHIGVVVATLGSATYENESWTGPISAEYFYHPEKWIGFGGIFVYGKNTQDVMVSGSSQGEITQSYYTLMPAVKFDWLRKKYFGMYTKLGVGATIRKDNYDGESETATHFNWQASLLGIETGSPNIRAFAELGFGEQGIILGGVRYKF